ncbi:MAG: hypothetical protein OXH19_04145 [Chloroflexi bacterium]|nr:hypothetical protein [Chloroflexota bacterium]MCY3588466.1 hypothetical protein [Chloroflexota bacterium]MCY3686817.1 hypothetical protein [Chloroflexota bacterium]MDE2709391.1 hypothetical protein [Chloroflexota bacterium]
MVSSERSGEADETVGVREAQARVDQRVEDLSSNFNGRIGDLRSHVNERFDSLRSEFNRRHDNLRAEVDAKLKLLMWGIGIGFATVLALLGVLLARGG